MITRVCMISKVGQDADVNETCLDFEIARDSADSV